jgi:hypothetical protein
VGLLEQELARVRGEARREDSHGAAPTPEPAAAPAPERSVVPGGPWVDRAAVEGVMFAHALRDETGRAAGELLRLRAGRLCATPEGEALREELSRWQAARAGGDETPPAGFVQDGWHERDAVYRAYVTDLLAGEMVPDRADFVKAVRDGHERLEADAEMERRRAAAAR